ncbi:MAG: class I SAM-dependent methyltransferase [Pseudomonadota bacterium]
MKRVVEEIQRDFDLEVYRLANPDLGSLTTAELLTHWQTHGRREQRTAGLAQHRDTLRQRLVEAFESILEIGPYGRPFLAGDGVKYFDIADQQSLIKRAEDEGVGHLYNQVPFIDFHHPEGDLSVVPDCSFDLVYDSHSIEHHPDLVKHLHHVARLLKPNGLYIAHVPDKRFTFDHYFPLTTIAEVLDAHYSTAKRHSVAHVIGHLTYSTHNDSVAHWKGQNGEFGSLLELTKVAKHAIEHYREAAGRYIDVHAWRFTPRSLRCLMLQLNYLEFVDLKPIHVHETARDSSEFLSVMAIGRVEESELEREHAFHYVG